MPRRPQCECHEHASDEARGPCHVGIEGKCHWLLGREIRSSGWSGGVVLPYKGLDVCTAYACKKKAGLEVEGSARRGEVPMRAKRPKLATAGAPESEDALLSVKQAFQVVGHRYVDPQSLAMTDPVTLREPLSLERSKSEWLLRGLFKARNRPLDAGKYSFEWVEHGEALAAAWAEGTGGFAGAVQAYFNSLTAAASAEPEEPEPESTVPAPAPARAPASSGGGGGDQDGSGVGERAPDHAELVQQLNAHIKEKGMSLDGKKNSILSQLTPLGHILQSALSIWLGRARNSAGVSDAALGKIDEIARAYLSGASDGEGSSSGGGGGSCGGGGSGGGSGGGGGGGGGRGGRGGGGAAARTAAGSTAHGRRKSSVAGAWRDASELDADAKRVLDSYGDIGALRRPLEVMLGAPIGARFTLEASLHANEADSFADGIEQKIRGAQYVPAILQRTGAWAWKVSSSRSPDPVHAVFTDMDGVQDQLFNRFVRAYYRVVDNE